MNRDACRDGMHHAKNRGIPLAILSRILAQSCITLCLNYVGRVMHDCARSLIAKGISLFPRFFAWCIPSLHPNLSDFCTCILSSTVLYLPSDIVHFPTIILAKCDMAGCITAGTGVLFL